MTTKAGWYLKERGLEDLVEHLQPAIEDLQHSIESFFAVPPLDHLHYICDELESTFPPPTQSRKRQAQILRQMLLAIDDAGAEVKQQDNIELTRSIYGSITCYYSNTVIDGMYMILLTEFICSS